MTDKEKQFLMDLFDRNELSLDTIMRVLGIGALRTAVIAHNEGYVALENAMCNLDFEILRYLKEGC